MKKTSLLVALPAVALSGLLLTGCGMFHSRKAWNTAQQESPLEIPPSLDRPAVSDALVIPPPGANKPTSNGAIATVGAAAKGQIADGFVLNDNVDSTYRRVGQVLQSGSLGNLVAHDDTAHTYALNVSAAAMQPKKKGFFARHFGHHKDDAADAASSVGGQVKISITGNGTSASEIRAEGSVPAVAKVIDTLKVKLGK